MQIGTQNSSTQGGNSFARPIELLLSCHEKISRFSSALSVLSQTLQSNGWDDSLAASADQICRYFNIASPEHHLDEENHLFPALMAADPQLKNTASVEIIQQLNELIKQHVEFDELWATLNTMLSERSEDFTALHTLAETFKSRLHAHILIENKQIFPYAETLLNEAEMKAIGLAIAQRRGIRLPPHS